MTRVVSIQGPNVTTEADVWPLADDLRLLADHVESGKRPARRGVFVYQDPSGMIRHIALGDALSKVECVGLLAWAIDNVKNA